MPTKWRQAFKEGVEAWQPAFAAAGFGDKAIRAVLPDDPDWPKDYRYHHNNPPTCLPTV